MKRFFFPLQRVLEFRRQQEDLERGRLGALLEARRRLESQAERQQAESRRERAACARTAGVPATEVRRVFEGAAALLRLREHTLTRAEEVEHDRLRQLQVVLEARRRVRLLELLRARRRFRHGRLADREQEILDGELYLAKLLREQREKKF